MLKDSGLTTIMVLAILVAVWTASVSVADEIEGRTALTLLSKPISRRQFVLGKFLGIVWPILLMFVVLGRVDADSRFRTRSCTTPAKRPTPSRPGSCATPR